MQLFTQIEQLLLELSKTLPLELFIFIGSFVEELIPPIPSALITITVGTILAARDMSFGHIIWLAVFGAIGKSIGASIVYVAADKAEDVLLGKFGKFVGVSHKHVEGLSKRFTGGWRDHVTLFVLRSLPIMPSTPVSVVSGVIKLNYKTYLLQTFLGTIVRDAFFIYIGTLGVAVYGQLTHYIERTEDLIKYGFVLVVAGIFAYILVKKYKDKIADRIMDGK